MTNKERNQLAAAIFETLHTKGADRNTVIAVAQAIERAFDADDKFRNFAASATALFTNIDYRTKLAERQLEGAGA